MFGITDLTTFVVGTILIVLLPGPNSLYVMSVASRYGIRTGYAAACGVFTGDSILMLCTIFGAASLLKTFPILFVILKVTGGCYLAYLGFKLLKAAYATWRTSPHVAEMADLPHLDQIHPYRTALNISLLNPKAILFFLSFFVQFVNPHYAYPTFTFLLLALIVQIVSFCYLTALIFSGAKLAKFFKYNYKLSATAICIVGVLFFAFGLKLASSTLS